MHAVGSLARPFVCAIALLFLLDVGSQAAKLDPNNLFWSVESIIDQSQEPFPEPIPMTLPGQFFTPRDNRGLAISNDGRYMYMGYNNSKVRNDSGILQQDRNGEVRMIDLTQPIGNGQYVTRVLGNRGKALAVDDVGRVYMAESDRIDIFSADLSTKLFTIGGLTETEGVAVRRESGTLMLYSSDRTLGTLSKRSITEAGMGVSGASLVGGFGVGGNLLLAGPGSSMRGVEIDGAGNIWVAGYGNNTLYRVSPDGSTVQSASITDPFDIGFNGDQVFVTHHINRVLSIFDVADFLADMLPPLASAVAPPWMQLRLDPIAGNIETGDPGALSGIVVIPDYGFYVTNELGQTENQHSTYGDIDAFSGFDGMEFFTDVMFDDNEPLLFARIPEPAGIVLASMALVGLLLYRRRQRRAAQ